MPEEVSARPSPVHPSSVTLLIPDFLSSVAASACPTRTRLGHERRASAASGRARRLAVGFRRLPVLLEFEEGYPDEDALRAVGLLQAAPLRLRRRAYGGG